MNDISGQAGELRFTVQIKRKETGKVEEYELIGKVTDEEAEKLGLKKEAENGRNP